MSAMAILDSRSKVFLSTILAAIAIVALAHTAAASSTTMIYSFAGGKDGEYLDTDLVVDASGNIYGTTVQGGAFSSGTVWQLSPSGSGWTHAVLYSFHGGNDGGEPYKGVTLDAHGNLYGTTVAGGSGACDGGCGVVYKLTHNNGVWTQTVLHSFTGGADGSGPGNGVTIDPHGNIYGMTPTGGDFGYGTVYELLPQSGGGFRFQVIHAFTGGVDGASASAGRLTLDGKGNLYGVTTVGGAHNDGVVFELTRGQAGWTLLPLYSFQDQPDGALPYGGVILDKAGNLYGTTYYAGANDVGTVYELEQNSGGWSETILYNFKGGTDGSSPIGGLVPDKSGNLYGTTSDGGTSGGFGVIFGMKNSGGKWAEAVVYRFPGAPGLSLAYNGMASSRDGNFYGATVHGGPANDGAIYRFTP